MTQHAVYTFEKQNSHGMTGENFIIDYLSRCFRDHEIKISKINFTSKNWHEADLLISKNREIKVEVKTDSYESGNFFLETVSNVRLNTPGCIQASKSDFFIYYFSNLKKIALFKTKLLKEWLNINYCRFRSRDVPNKNYKTRGVLVPIEELKFEALPLISTLREAVE